MTMTTMVTFLESMLPKVKGSCKKKEYDCIILPCNFFSFIDGGGGQKIQIILKLLHFFCKSLVIFPRGPIRGSTQP
eukprot:UN08981